MNQMERKRTIAAAITAAALAATGPTLATAQTMTDELTAESPSEWTSGDAYMEPTSSGKQKTQAKAKGSSTPEQECEAMERTEARWQKFLAEGTPEQFGSEEPFTFDPSVC